MTNTALYLNMIDRYNALAYTHDYIFGFHFAGNIYMAYADSSMLPALLTLDKASRGQGMALRFNPNKGVKVALMPNATLLCSKDFFDSELENSKYNKGELFEKMVTEYYGQEWHKDNVPFTDAGDLDVDDMSYQIKFEKATFTNEKILMKLERE